MMAACKVAIAGPATMAHNWAVFHFGAGPALAEHDGAVMSASAGPALGRRGMLTGQFPRERGIKAPRFRLMSIVATVAHLSYAELVY